MKKCLLLFLVLCVYVLNAQFNINDYVWIYDAANPPSLEQVEDMWQKPVWAFAAQDDENSHFSYFLKKSLTKKAGVQKMAPSIKNLSLRHI